MIWPCFKAFAWIAGVVLGGAVFTPAVSAREVPDLGLILNDDAYSAFTQPKLADSVRHLHETVDAYAAGGIGTLCYSVAEGSALMVYPTQVASTWGWRPTPYDDDPRYAERIARNRRAIEQGGDAVRVAGERARQHGMRFIPSLRMNDSHFMTKPLENPFTGRFWVEHQELAIKHGGGSPIVSRASYGELLDFSHEAVRQHRLDTIFEVIDRYADLIDGFEMDFNRVQVLFPLGKAQGRAHLVTDMVRHVRRRLDELEASTGRPYYLIVRVPPSIESCDWAGLDVRAWMGDRLVDVVSPAVLMTMDYQMPVGDFLAAAEGTGCRVYPSLYPRTVWRWPLRLDEPDVGRPSRAASPEQVRAAGANMWQLGVDGLYLYNYRKGMLDGAVQDIRSPAALAGTDKCFTITKGYYLDHEGTYEHRKQLPAPFKDGRVVGLRLLVGDDLSAAPGGHRIARCLLRLGARGLPERGAVRVVVNGERLYAGPIATVLRNLPEQKRALSKAPDLAHQLIHLPVEASAVFRQGFNTVTIDVHGEPGVPGEAGEAAAVLTDVELMVDYEPAG